MLKRYNVTHIVIFTTWTTTQQSQIAYLGYGEDNKWYWMTRIGNGTTFHGETVRFYERRTAEETKYFRVIQVGNRVIANETIADQNGVMENTILGKLMREGISSKGAVLTDYFRLVFSSTNRWVLLYEVSYPTKTIVTCSLSRSDVKYNETLRIAGRVVDQDNRPVPAAQVTIEYSENKGLTWNSVIKVSTNETGWYSYNWLSDAGQFLVRAGWEGVRGKYLAAKSGNMSLSVTRVPISISCTLSSYDIGVHQNVTITCQLSYPISTGNVTVQYSLDNVTWKQLATGVPHRGMYNLTFTPAEEGTLYIRAIFLGTRNYEETVSPIQVATVRSK